MRRINGEDVVADRFVYDGCHKIYLLESKEAEKDARSKGYKTFPISGLLKAYVYSCPLRFIHKWDEQVTCVVPQWADSIVFEGFRLDHDAEMLEYEISRSGGKITLSSSSSVGGVCGI